MIIPIHYAGDRISINNMINYVSHLIACDGCDLHERNIDAWERWYHSMEVE